MKNLSFFIFIFYANLSAQAPANFPRTIGAIADLISPAKQATLSITKGTSNVIRATVNVQPYIVTANSTLFNSQRYSSELASNEAIINQLTASWYDEIGDENTRIFGTDRPSAEDKKLHIENRKALALLGYKYQKKITIENQDNLSKFGSSWYKQIGSSWQEDRILQEIVWLQKAKGLPTYNYSKHKDRNVRKITQEGVELLESTLAEIRDNITLYKSIVAVTGKQSVLKNSEIITDMIEFKNYYFKAIDKYEYSAELYSYLLKNAPKQQKSIKKKSRSITIDFKEKSFSSMLSSIQKEIKHEVVAMGNIEMSLIELGFIEFDLSKIHLNNENDLQNEFRYLRDRLENGIADFKDAYKIETNKKLTYDEIEAIVNQELLKLYSMLRATMHNGDDISNVELLQFYRKAKNRSSETPVFFDRGIRESIYKDTSAKVYYVKGTDGIEVFQKETVEIKVEGKETVSKDVIKLVANTNLYTEINPTLSSKIASIRNNLNKTIEKENTHILFFTKFKNKNETKGDDTIDSLKRMFRKEHISFIYNRSDKAVRRQLKRAYRSNKEKTIFNISHIDNGALMSTENSNYVLPIEELNTFSRKFGVNDYLAGCNGAYYENTGTTDLINMLGFATAIGESIRTASSHGEFMSAISTNNVIKGKTGEVKLLMDEMTFSNEYSTSAAVFKKEEKLWRYLTRLFLQKTN